MDARTGGLADAPAAAASDWPSPRRAWYALVVLTVGLMIATVDRGILTLLVAPIRAHLGISDTQFTVLNGWAFVSVYAVLGLPIARLADRGSRRLIIGIGMAFWSADDGAVRLRELVRAVLRGARRRGSGRVGVCAGDVFHPAGLVSAAEIAARVRHHEPSALPTAPASA